MKLDFDLMGVGVYGTGRQEDARGINEGRYNSTGPPSGIVNGVYKGLIYHCISRSVSSRRNIMFASNDMPPVFKVASCKHREFPSTPELEAFGPPHL